MSKQSARGAAWEIIRRQVLERDEYTCRYCGREATEADHIIARSKGGTDTLDNLVAACKPCNAAKGARGTTARTTYINRRWLDHV